MNATLRQLEALDAAAKPVLLPVYLRALTAQLFGQLGAPQWAEFQKLLERILVFADLTGRAHVLNHLRMQGVHLDLGNEESLPEDALNYAEQPRLLTAGFLEALRAFERRVPRLRATLARVGPRARVKAFTVTGVEGLGALKALKARIAQSLEGRPPGAPPAEGSGPAARPGLPAFIEEAQDNLGVRLSAARLETVYRTNVMSALNEGTMDVLAEPDVAEHVALLQLNEIHDRRTRGNPDGLYPHAGPHFQMDGFVEAPNHPVWERIRPPNGYNCRATVSPLTWERATKLGLARDGKLLQEAIDRYNGPRWEFIKSGKYPDPGFKS